MPPDPLVTLSKLLAVMLRHEPERFGLTLDEAGYADLAQAWAALEERLPHVQYEDLLRVVAGDRTGKVRYEIVDDRIRALYGHSRVPVTYPPAVPPVTLYHGTTEAALPSILERGLVAQSRQYVHLTSSLVRAQAVARRHAANAHGVALLVILAAKAHAAGVVFHHPEPEHYLARHIPPDYITLHADAGTAAPETLS